MNAHPKHYARLAFLGVAVTGLLAATAIISPVVPSAAQTTEPPLVAMPLGTRAGHSDRIDAFVQGMRDLGYFEGDNIRYAFRFGEDYPDRESVIREMVGLDPAVLVVNPAAPRFLAPALESTIPTVVVFGSAGRMMEYGVQSLERPAGNVTGRAMEGIEPIDWLRLAQELTQGGTRIGYLLNSGPNIERHKQEYSDAALSLGVTVVFAVPPLPEDVVPAFDAVVAQGVDAIVVSNGGVLDAVLLQIADAARAARMPTVYHRDNAVPAGGLISLGIEVAAQYRVASYLVDRILRGEQAADIPITVSRPFVVNVNLDAAEAIGLTIPDSILTRAKIIGD